MFPGSLGPGEMLVLRLIAVLLFGKRLPEVGRSLGKGIVEFKKGLQGMGEDEPVTAATSTASQSHGAYESKLDPGHDYVVPKFEPPTLPPTRESAGTVARSDF